MDYRDWKTIEQGRCRRYALGREHGAGGFLAVDDEPSYARGYCHGSTDRLDRAHHDPGDEDRSER